MARRYEQITQLYQETLTRIRRDGENWSSFLKSSCRNYRLSFPEMVLVYAQRPDATAVLEMEQWNRRYGLWVKAGSKGIAVLDEQYSESTRLKYYFDVSDTRPGRAYTPPPIWEMKKEQAEDVRNTLEAKYGPFPDTYSLPGTIMASANEIAKNDIEVYFKDLRYFISGTALEELEESEVERMFIQLVSDSIGYAALNRCGYVAEDYIDPNDLALIRFFDTDELINALGTSVMEMNKELIGDIHRTVLHTRSDRTFELQSKTNYNEIRNDERRAENENRIYGTRGRIDSQSDSNAGRRGAAWQIRIDETAVSERISADPVQPISEHTDIEPSSPGNRINSQTEKKQTDGPIQDQGLDRRGAESERSYSVGTEYEPDRDGDRRDHQERTDLQLASTQQETDYPIPAFFTQEEYEALIKYDK